MHTVDLSQCEPLGEGLERPEDVAIGADGRVWASDRASCVAELLGPRQLRRVGRPGGEPNGITFTADGRLLVANFGNGHLDVIDPVSGEHRTLAEEAGGERLVCTNYLVVDRAGSIWGSCSSRRSDYIHAIMDGEPDGFLFRIDPDGGSEIVAPAVAFPNGLALDPAEEWLYCCRSGHGDVVRFPIRPDRGLGPQEPFGPGFGERRVEEWGEGAVDAVFGVGDARKPVELAHADFAVLARWGLTDGCGFDAEGNLWVTVATKNQVVVIAPSGEAHVALEDPEGRLVSLPTNVSWGGPDLRDLYLGSIGTPFVVRAPSPVAGMPLVHQR